MQTKSPLGYFTHTRGNKFDVKDLEFYNSRSVRPITDAQLEKIGYSKVNQPDGSVWWVRYAKPSK